jgi:antitoxin VapB
MAIVKTTRVFKSGNSQAVRLPKEFRLSCKTVEITRRGNELILRERPADFFAEGRVDPPPQRRRGL